MPERRIHEVPPLDKYEEILISIFTKLGFAFKGRTMPWTEIEAFLRITGADLNDTEITLFKHLSSVFVNGLEEYKKDNANIPYMTAITQKIYADAYTANRLALLRARQAQYQKQADEKPAALAAGN